MVFSSLEFIFFFLPIVLIPYMLCKNIRVRNIILVIASIIFYAFGEPKAVILMLLSIVLNYGLAMLMGKFWERKKIFLVLAVIINLALLVYYKYTSFFIESINSVLHINIYVPVIHLPIGISFFTFQAMMNMAANVKLLVDDCTDGIYLRWVNRHGYYCYWLFKRGDAQLVVSNDGEFIRNNMQDYSYKNGYHGGSGRKQRKTEENTLPVCAPLVDSDTYDFLFQLALSPVVDMYAGKDCNGTDRWKAVNISVGTYSKTRAVLQDFVAEIILPETRVQSL